MIKQPLSNLNGRISNDQILTLMNTYLTEWCYRDEMFWKHAFTYFYANLIVLFLPLLSEKIILVIPKHVPLWIFALVALCMSSGFLIVSLGDAKRLAAISDSYKRIAKNSKIIPPEVGWVTLESKDFSWNKKWKICPCFNRLLNGRMSVLLCVLMFASLFILSLVMLFLVYPSYNVEELVQDIRNC